MKILKSLSIVIPAYNEEDHLVNCLDSISKQSVPPEEVIVVDNNSTDRTIEIAKSYSFVRVVKEARQGVNFARTKGFNSAKSEIIGRIDADSELPEYWVRYVKDFYSNSENSKHGFTGGSYFYNVRFKRFASWLLGQMAFRMNRFMMGHYILYGSNMALPKNIWQQIKGDLCEQDDIFEDLDLSVHVHEAGYPITYHAGFKVGVKMRRVRSDYTKLWHNLMLWPRTLKVHNKKMWVLGWFGAVFLYLFSPVVPVSEFFARLFGKKPLEE